MRDGPIVQLVPTQYVPDAAAAIYTSPLTSGSNGIVLVTGWVIANTDATDLTITFYNVPEGGSPSGSNTILPSPTIKANNAWFHMKREGIIIIPAAGSLYMVASVADKITITLYGKEVS